MTFAPKHLVEGHLELQMEPAVLSERSGQDYQGLPASADRLEDIRRNVRPQSPVAVAGAGCVVRRLLLQLFHYGGGSVFVFSAVGNETVERFRDVVDFVHEYSGMFTLAGRVEEVHDFSPAYAVCRYSQKQYGYQRDADHTRTV